MFTNDDNLAGQLVRQVHLVTWRTFDEVDAGQLITNIHKCRRGGVKETSTGDGAH